MNKDEIIGLIKKISINIQINTQLCLAIAGHETNYDASKTRYEPRWSYFSTPYWFANKLGISVDTERILQAISWGPLQVMGSVCRELGYCDQLPLLVQPELGILFGCRKLKSLSAMYSNEKDVIASFNAGKPTKDAYGNYINQGYVSDVTKRLNELRGNSTCPV